MDDSLNPIGDFDVAPIAAATVNALETSALPIRKSGHFLTLEQDPKLNMSFSPLRSSPLLRRTTWQSIRLYHSPNHPQSPRYTPQQQKILGTALSLVPTHGFTSETLREGAKQAGYLEITHNLFPRGPWSLIEYHLVTQREKLSSVPHNEGGVGKTIRKLCVERLKGNKEIIGRWQEVYPLQGDTEEGTGCDVATAECRKFID